MTDPNATLACNLTDPELRDRKAVLQARVKPHLTQSTYTTGTARLMFAKPGVAREELEHFMELERACCPFFSFQLEETSAHFEVIITGPAGSEDMVRDVFMHPGASEGCCATPAGKPGNRTKTYVAGLLALCAVGCAVPPLLVALGLVGAAAGAYLGSVMEGAIISIILVGIGLVAVRFLKKRQAKVSS